MRPDQRFFVDFFCALAHPEPGYKEQLIGLVDSKVDVEGQYEKLDGLRAKLEHRLRALQCARSPYTGYTGQKAKARYIQRRGVWVPWLERRKRLMDRVSAHLSGIEPELYLLSMASLIRGFREVSAEKLQEQLLSSVLETPGAMLSRPTGEAIVLP